MKKLLLPLIALITVACNSGPSTDPKVESVRLDAAKQTRTLFEKSGGNFDALSPEDKAAALKLFNGKEADARRSWSEMGARTGGGGVSGSPSSGPSGGATPGSGS